MQIAAWLYTQTRWFYRRVVFGFALAALISSIARIVWLFSDSHVVYLLRGVVFLYFTSLFQGEIVNTLREESLPGTYCYIDDVVLVESASMRNAPKRTRVLIVCKHMVSSGCAFYAYTWGEFTGAIQAVTNIGKVCNSTWSQFEVQLIGADRETKIYLTRSFPISKIFYSN